MSLNNRTIEAAASAIANENGLQEGGMYPGSPNVSKEIEKCMRSMSGSTKAKVQEVLNSEERSSFIVAVQKMLSNRYGA